MIQRLVHRGNGTLPEGVVKCIVDRKHADTQASCSITINIQPGLQTACLLIGGQISQSINLAHRGQQLDTPLRQFTEAVPAQRILILGRTLSTTNPQVLNRRQNQSGPRKLARFFSNAINNLVGAVSFGFPQIEERAFAVSKCPLIDGLQCHEQAGRITGATATELATN